MDILLIWVEPAEPTSQKSYVAASSLCMVFYSFM